MVAKRLRLPVHLVVTALEQRRNAGNYQNLSREKIERARGLGFAVVFARRAFRVLRGIGRHSNKSGRADQAAPLTCAPLDELPTTANYIEDRSRTDFLAREIFRETLRLIFEMRLLRAMINSGK
jgi:hypothetical protein